MRTLHPTLRWLAALVGLALIVEVYRQWTLVSSTTVALSLLIYILLLAACWGLRIALVISTLAAACYNFFFLPPIGTFTIRDPQNWIALSVFLAVSVAASRMSARMRDEASKACSRENEVRILYKLGRSLLATEEILVDSTALPMLIARDCAARSATSFVLEDERLFTTLPPSSLSCASLKELSLLPGVMPYSEPSGGIRGHAVPLRVGVAPRGVLLLESELLSVETLEAIGGLVSIALDRSAALSEATRSEADKAREQLRSIMLDSITHELRTPLTGIKGAVSTLLMPSQLLNGDSQCELLTIIDEECDRLNRLVAQSLEMARLDANRIRMQRTEISVSTLIDCAVATCAAAIKGRDLTVEHTWENVAVYADGEWMERVLCHLIENAAKYSFPGGTLAISVADAGNMVSIEVRDQGEGVDPEDRTLIFEKFYRGSAFRQMVPGTGMGLTICRSIVEAHKGTLAVVDRTGWGAVFQIKLPKYAR